MLTNYHTHTTRCGHAEGTEEEYILTALRCGFKVLGFSDHTPWAYATPGFVSRIRMLPSQLDDYVLTLRGLREKYADKLHIRIGLEAEYFPAYLGWLKEEMERLDIEYLILGCHYDTTDEQDAKARRFGGSASHAAQSKDGDGGVLQLFHRRVAQQGAGPHQPLIVHRFPPSSLFV